MDNRIIETVDAFGDPKFTISYYVSEGNRQSPYFGKQLSGGVAVVREGRNVVDFGIRQGKQPVWFLYDERPLLAALAAEYTELCAKRDAVIKERNEAKRQADTERDQALLDDMHRRAEELVKSIPADHVRVNVTQTGDLDGYPILQYDADGVSLNWQDVENHGIVSAQRPGALNSFADVRVCSIHRDKLAEIKSAQEDKARTSDAAKAVRAKELADTHIPAEAVEAYNAYHGDSDAAWEDENETAWALIRTWSPCIEAQFGMDRRKFAKELNESVCEAEYGTSD